MYTVLNLQSCVYEFFWVSDVIFVLTFVISAVKITKNTY